MATRTLIMIPAYNEASCIAQTVEEVREATTQLHHLSDFSILVVDDGSRDDTAEVCHKLGVEVVTLPVNLGIGGAVQAGYQYAQRHGYDHSLQIDADGQHNASEIPLLFETMAKTGADLVVGSRFLEKTDYKPTLARKLGMQFSRCLFRRSTGIIIYDTTSGFRLSGPRAIAYFSRDYPTKLCGTQSLIMGSRRGLKIVEVSCHFRRRATGKSSIVVLKALTYPFRLSMATLEAILQKDS